MRMRMRMKREGERRGQSGVREIEGERIVSAWPFVVEEKAPPLL